MNSEGITLRQGWRAAAAGAAVASLVTWWLIDTVEVWPWLSPRLALGGLALYFISLAIGFRHGVGFAAVPLLTAAAFSEEVAVAIDWGRPLIIGCMWYVATELAWESITRRAGIDAAPAVARQRQREVATVVIVTIVLGLGAAAVATLAPARTLLLRAVVIVLVAAALGAALTRLNRAAEPARSNA